MAREFLAIRRNPLAFLERMWKQYGDVVQFPIPSPPSYLVNDVESIRRILVEAPREYSKRTLQYRSLAMVTGEGLLVADHDRWRSQRQLVQPAFHVATLSRIVGYVDDVCARLISQWKRPGVVDLDAAMMEGALEIVGRALFGADLSADATELTAATLDALDVVVGRARTPVQLPGWLPTAGNRKLGRALATLDAAVESMIAARDSDASMLDALLAARDDEGHSLDHQGVRDEIVTFIVAGHETVASALTWTWGLLAEHPQVQRELHAELDAVLGGRFATIDDVESLPYARAVFDEALRLYPPAWLITRTSTSDDVLGGREIPAGSLIIMSPYLLHRHTDLWSHPEAFDPTRTFDRNAFIPFGNGLRLCIGRDFAYLEAVLMLANLAQHIWVSYPAGESLPTYVPLVTMRPPNGLRLRVTPREASR